MDLLFSSLRAGLGRLLALPRRPGGRARKASHGWHGPGCELGSCPTGLPAYSCCSVGEMYLSNACEPSVLSCGAVLVRSVATLNRGDPIDPGNVCVC